MVLTYGTRSGHALSGPPGITVVFWFTGKWILSPYKSIASRSHWAQLLHEGLKKQSPNCGGRSYRFFSRWSSIFWTSFVCKTHNHVGKISDPRINRGANQPLIEIIFLSLLGAVPALLQEPRGRRGAKRLWSDSALPRNPLQMAPLGAETRRCATYNRSLLNVDCLAITDVAKPRDCVQFDGIRYGL